MTIHIDTSGLDRFGWMRIDSAVPAGLCERGVEILEAEMDVPLHDQSRWHEYSSNPRDLMPIWGPKPLARRNRLPHGRALCHIWVVVGRVGAIVQGLPGVGVRVVAIIGII